MDSRSTLNGKDEKNGKAADYSFQVDLKGIIRLLSENLYSSGDVFLRELLQNCVDAVEARRVADPEFTDGWIRISYHLEKPKQAKLVFADNGIGLTREEIHTFLSVIGQSSKRGEMKRGSFIGQFGIGLLSCFLVTDEIFVRSRSVHEQKAYCWLGHSDGTYQVMEEPGTKAAELGKGVEETANVAEAGTDAAEAERKMMEPGTEVVLQLKGKMVSRYGEEQVVELLKEYGFLLKLPVEFSGDGGKRRINDGFIPWRQSFCSNEEILQFGERMFGETFFGVVPVSGEGLKGYAFISERQTSAAAAGRHKIFLKNMLITEDGKDLVPKWAFFTRCILNAENLTPMASREGFVSDHQLAKARNTIEQCIFDYFVALSQFDIDKLKRLTLVHNTAIKSLAVENEQIYKLFFPFLVFSTNKGSLTGFQIAEAAKKMMVYYCTEVDDYRRARPLVDNGRRILINAGYIYDTKLIQLLKRYQRGIQVKLFDEDCYGELLEEPDERMKKSLGELAKAAGRALAPFRCSAVLKQFDPPEVPALYVAGTDDFLDNAFDSMFPSSGFFGQADGFGESRTSGFLEGFDFGTFGKDEDGFGSKLYLNAQSPMLLRLAQVTEEEITENMVRVLYVHAMLAGHYSLGEREMEILNMGLIKLLEYGLGGNE